MCRLTMESLSLSHLELVIGRWRKQTFCFVFISEIVDLDWRELYIPHALSQ